MKIGAVRVSTSATSLGRRIDFGLLALTEALKADHGFNVESRAIRCLIEIMTGYDAPTRRDYLQFITGSPKLPIGGLSLVLLR